jgi:FkbM family methyltransferase
LVPRLAVAGRTSFDVGANRGMYAAAMRRYSKDVVAFEPNPDIAAFLRSVANGSIAVEQCALSDREGSLDLLIPVHARGFAMAGHATLLEDVARDWDNVRRVNVPLRRLDEYARYDVGFIKIDVEGNELAVLHGGAALIDRCRPNVLVECEERHVPGSVAGVRSFLEAFGYQGFFFHDGHLVPIAEFDVRVHQQPEALVYGGRHKNYVNNFVYLAGT